MVLGTSYLLFFIGILFMYFVTMYLSRFLLIIFKMTGDGIEITDSMFNILLVINVVFFFLKKKKKISPVSLDS